MSRATDFFVPAEYKFEFQHCVEYRFLRDKYRPLVMAEFKYGEEECCFSMLVDTGADNIVLPASVASLLGIDYESLPETTANTFHHGATNVRVGPELSFCLADLRPEKSFRRAVHFAPMLEAYGYGLLGREILNEMRLCFTQSEQLAFYIGFND